jgi:hypothetical protein
VLAHTDLQGGSQMPSATATRQPFDRVTETVDRRGELVLGLCVALPLVLQELSRAATSPSRPNPPPMNARALL